ncbi:hypothetical protein [Fructilactobacillus sanfranciscensis]|uniref:hypothetical protein n=1 Tax=Fructilactobacillus sanfranciscensis TaxID=1625 RepID=UPI003757E269
MWLALYLSAMIIDLTITALVGGLLAGPFSKWLAWTDQMMIILVLILISLTMVLVDWKKLS